MADDPLKTALDEIRAIDSAPALALLSEAARDARKGYAPEFDEEEIDAAGNAVTALDLARGRLLGVVDAALKLAGELAGGDDPAEPPALTEDRAWVRQECAARFREAIARELTGTTTGAGLFGFECGACGAQGGDWGDSVSALRANIAHLGECGAPDAEEYLQGARETLAELTGKADGDAEG